MSVNPGEVPYICERCKHPITALNDGVFFITDEEYHKATEHSQKLDIHKAHSVLDDTTGGLDGLELYFPSVSWHIVHDQCLEEDETSGMFWDTDISRIRTFQNLLGMALHLGEKPWIGATDLNQVLLHYSEGF